MNGRSLWALSIVGLLGCGGSGGGGCNGPVRESGLNVDPAWEPAEQGVTYTMAGSQLDALGSGGRITMQTLQGVINRDAPRMFLAIDSGDAHDSEFLDLLTREHGMTAQAEQDALWYLWAFSDDIDGYVLFQNTNKESVSAAVSLAGSLNAIAVDQLSQDIFRFVEEELQLPQLADVRDYTDADLIADPLFGDLAPGLQMMESFSGPEAAPRDFAVSLGIPVMYADVRDATFPGVYGDVWAGLPSGTPVYGWGVPLGGDPQPLVEELSKLDLGLVPTGNANNLSVYAHYPLPGDLAQIHDGSLPDLDNRHVVAFVMSGGENLGTLMGRITNQEVGNFKPAESYPVGWTIGPAVADYAGPVAQWIYEQSGGDNWFLMGASGSTLAYPSLITNRTAWVDDTLADMARMDHRVLVATDLVDAFTADPYEDILASDQVDAVFFAPAEVDPDAWGVETVLWAHDKPIVPMWPLGFDPEVEKTLDIVDQVAVDIAERASADLASASGYTLVYVNTDKTRLSDLAALEDELAAAEDDLGLSFRFEVVRPDELLLALKGNLTAE